jgi:hypothetical protein
MGVPKIESYRLLRPRMALVARGCPSPSPPCPSPFPRDTAPLSTTRRTRRFPMAGTGSPARGAGCLCGHPVPRLRRKGLLGGLSSGGRRGEILDDRGGRDPFPLRPTCSAWCPRPGNPAFPRDVGRVRGNRLAGGHRAGSGARDHPVAVSPK